MAFQKFGDREKIKLLDNEEVNVLQSHVAKTGKAIQDFSDEERTDLYDQLDKNNNQQ